MRYTVQEIVLELKDYIKLPMDPALRKLLRKTLVTLGSFIDLVGEPEPTYNPETVEKILEAQASLPSLATRIKDSE